MGAIDFGNSRLQHRAPLTATLYLVTVLILSYSRTRHGVEKESATAPPPSPQHPLSSVLFLAPTEHELRVRNLVRVSKKATASCIKFLKTISPERRKHTYLVFACRRAESGITRYIRIMFSDTRWRHCWACYCRNSFVLERESIICLD